MTDGKRSHIVADTIGRVLQAHGIEDEAVAEDVMLALDQVRLVSYQRKDNLPLLSVAGRTLVLVMESPNLTLREIAVRQGTVESNVQRSMSQLVEAGLVERSRVGRRNYYRVDVDAVTTHPDVWRLLVAVEELELAREPFYDSE